MPATAMLVATATRQRRRTAFRCSELCRSSSDNAGGDTTVVWSIDGYSPVLRKVVVAFDVHVRRVRSMRERGVGGRGKDGKESNALEELQNHLGGRRPPGGWSSAARSETAWPQFPFDGQLKYRGSKLSQTRGNFSFFGLAKRGEAPCATSTPAHTINRHPGTTKPKQMLYFEVVHPARKARSPQWRESGPIPSRTEARGTPRGRRRGGSWCSSGKGDYLGRRQQPHRNRQGRGEGEKLCS